MNTKITQQKGFTIIEVVLVLAIAALIFLMIFVALPALQRGQRDTARKNDQNAVVSAINSWTGNNRGTLPNLSDTAIMTTFQNDYIGDKLNQYTNDQISNATDDAGISAVTTENIVIVTGHKCNTTNVAALGDVQQRSAAVYIRTEASNAIVCADA